MKTQIRRTILQTKRNKAQKPLLAGKAKAQRMKHKLPLLLLKKRPKKKQKLTRRNLRPSKTLAYLTL